MPGRSGLDLVRELRALDPATRILVLTGYGSIATAVEAMKLGAVHYLTKPADADEILAALGGVEATARVRPRRFRRPRWRGPSGNTSTACWPTAPATSRRRPAGWASTGDRCSASWRSIRPAREAGRIQNSGG